MTEEKYQITTKAYYINVLLLKDELKYFDKLLSETIVDLESWLTKLRTTRSVFLTLNNVSDAVNKIRVGDPKEFTAKTRALRKELVFANHFRNRGIGHLDNTLLKRAVQWRPQLFYENTKDNEVFKIIESHQVIIEACTNSFIDKNGIQKVFETEIDLMYPPDEKLFFGYLNKLVFDSISWLEEAGDLLLEDIEHHGEDELHELAAIAGQTNFNLNEDSIFSYSLEEHREVLSKALKSLKEMDVDPQVLELIKDWCQPVVK
jgi:hypothetical protein